MQVVVVDNYKEMSQMAAELFRERMKEKPNLVLGLATGSTPVGTYRQLIEMHQAGTVSFKQATAFNLDEYCGLDGSHEQSYAFFMEENLFQSIDIEKSRTFIPNGMASDIQAECARYDAMIEAHGGVDLQLLGIGGNGHIGFNEPDASLSAGTHEVVLDASTIMANSRFFKALDEVPKKALTMGMGSILKAKEILLLAAGANKAEAVQGLLSGKITTDNPASFLQLHPKVTVIIDRDLANCLKEEKTA